jgi:hypothetical protein
MDDMAQTMPAEYYDIRAARKRIATLEAAIEAIHTMRLNWALVCQCKCSECDILFEAIRDVLPESQSTSGAVE